MVNFKGLTAKAKQLAQRNPDKVDKVLDQAGSFVDKRTGRKYERHVDSVQQKARRFLGGGHAPGDRTAGDPAPGGPAPSGPTTGGPAAGERPDGQPGGPAATDRPGDVPGTGEPDRGPRH
ncbi:antitoxin [uncultured Kocuria sp.]|uniref:antitoxin n=1 Tax=uncultured Kocuria sp. TaxID=259305 RepID=UPI002602CE35|nr:antitoxin [uncultured Kocuria sp.]